MDKQQREDLAEANAIIDFRNQGMTWKHWAIVVAVTVVAYVFFTGLKTIFNW